MSDGGKGSSPRPFSVNQEQFASNWDTIFGKKSTFKDLEEEADERARMAELKFAKPHCYCYNCNKDYTEPGSVFPYVHSIMIVCPECGNKRCPHATDHSFACTGSNEPGQTGSRYE